MLFSCSIPFVIPYAIFKEIKLPANLTYRDYGPAVTRKVNTSTTVFPLKTRDQTGNVQKWDAKGTSFVAYHRTKSINTKPDCSVAGHPSATNPRCSPRNPAFVKLNKKDSSDFTRGPRFDNFLYNLIF